MITFLAVIHILFCIVLISLVLLQDPKGGAAGGIFGGGSNSLMGATGGTSFLAKLTRFSAIGFAVLCLLMTWYMKRDTGSVLDIEPAGAVQLQPAPGTTENQPAKESAPAAPAEKK
jgi:preprotein translocase subunit SecG